MSTHPASSPTRRPRLRGTLAATFALGALGLGLLVSAPGASADTPGGGGVSIGVSVPYSGIIACVDGNKDPITDASTLHRGDKMFCTINGLPTGHKVSATFNGMSSPAKTATAGADGMAALDVVVPDSLADGTRTLTFASGSTTYGKVPFTLEAGPPTELDNSSNGTSGGSSDGSSDGSGDSGNGADSAGAAGAGSGNGSDGGAGTDAAGHSGGTAFTGVDVLGLGLAAAALVGGGVLLTVLGRRRRVGRVTA